VAVYQGKDKTKKQMEKGMDDSSDEELVSQVLRGKTQVYALLVDRYERPVFNLMYRYCRSDQEAADLSQDAFLRAYERLASFNIRRKFFPWLYTLAINRAKDWQRGNSRKLKNLAILQWERPNLDTGSYQEKQLLNHEEVKQLYGALDTLPETTREMVLLRYRQERPIRELASIFKLSESGVKMRISRALDHMRAVLGGNRNE